MICNWLLYIIIAHVLINCNCKIYMFLSSAFYIKFSQQMNYKDVFVPQSMHFKTMDRPNLNG